MPSEYGDCCMGAECSMPIKTVTFYHHSIMCSGFLHVPCGVTDIDDRTTCLQCYQKSRPNVGDKSPRKLAAVFVEAHTPPTTMTTRNRQKRATATEE